MMRISSGQQYDSYRARIASRQAELFAAQQKVLTGKSFTKASENPTAARQVISAKSLMGRAEQIGSNLNAAKQRLSYNEQAMSDVTTLLNRARSLVTQGANDTQTDGGRQAIAKELQDLRDQLVRIGNTQDSRGSYIFSGQKLDQKPFNDGTGTLTYAGDGLQIQVEIAPGERMNTALEDPAGLVTDIYARLTSAIDHLNGGNAQQLSDEDIAGLQKLGDRVSLTRGRIGADMARVNSLKEQNETRLDDLTAQVSDLQEIDIAEAITRYQQAEMAYSAALQTVAKGFELSLMNFIR